MSNSSRTRQPAKHVSGAAALSVPGHLGWAWGIPGLVSFFIQQRLHQARAAVGEGLEAFLA
uniref:hypothetical protein n=1 Tax=Salmonella enterica TaxID=28901 RepID=UPI00329894DE